MTCASCGFVSAPGQKFCGDCGAALARGCPGCGTANPPSQRFCGDCGTELAGGTAGASGGTVGGPGARTRDTTIPAAQTGPFARPGSAPVAERRLVSVLFADLVGFTPFAEERDPEDVRDVLTRYFDLSSDVIGRYGGTVEKFIGDAVMAVWGTPTAREDDAERAVRAGLELVDAVRALGAGIQARCGVLTGEAAVTLGAVNQGMVAGDLVNTAARLQSVASPGTVLVGEPTFRSASQAIVFEPAGDQLLKGKVAPVPAWRAVRVVAERGGRGRTDALEAPFVGRDEDLRLLKDLFHNTGRDRRVRHVSVIGAGGVGKSRLAWEFEKYLDGIAERVWWHQGRSPAYGESITFWALGEMIRVRAGLSETNDEPATRAGIAAMLDTHLGADPDRNWIESALLELLGIRTGVPSDELFGAWRTFFERVAASGTVLLVFQDLHWADSGTLDFIDHLVEWSRGAPIFILSLSRPELLEKRPGWGAAQRSFTSLYLEPLDESAMRELLAGVVPGLPTATADAIVARAEGVPLYAIETIRMLVANGQLTASEDGTYQPSGSLDELAVPETLTALIAARLDTLETADRSLLLDAAVLGQSFMPAGLAAISGFATEELETRLRSLVRRELLTQVSDPRSPERGQFAFVQALIREVAYNTLSKKDRKVRHLAAARWFESLGEPELAGALAGHYLAARANAPDGAEADALAAQARIALKSAAERAASLGAHRQAVTFFEQALTVTNDETELGDLHHRAGESAAIAADFDRAEDHLTRSLDRYRIAGDRSTAASIAARLGENLLNGRRVERAFTVLESAVLEYADLGDDPGRLRLVSQLSRGLYLNGATARAIELADQVLDVAERTDQLLILADTLVTKGSAMALLGRRREGLGVLEVGGKLAEVNGFTSVALRAHNNSLSNRTELDPRAAFEAATSGLQLARRLGQSGWIHSFAGNLGFVALRTGEWDTGIVELESALADTADSLDRLLLVNNLTNLRAVRGDAIGEGVAELEATAKSTSDLASQTFLAETQGWVALTSGRLSEARDRWREMADLDSSSSGSAYAWTSRVSLWLGDAMGAERDLARFWASVAHGGVVDVVHLGLRAGIAGLLGDRATATGQYRETIRGLREARLPFDEAILAIDMAYVLGHADPLVMDAVGIARATLAGLRSAPLLALLEDAVAMGGRPEAGSGSGARRTSAARDSSVEAEAGPR